MAKQLDPPREGDPSQGGHASWPTHGEPRHPQRRFQTWTAAGSSSGIGVANKDYSTVCRGRSNGGGNRVGTWTDSTLEAFYRRFMS